MAAKTEKKKDFPMKDISDWNRENDKKKAKGKAKEFRKDFQAFWEAGIDWQKDAIDLSKKQRKQLFANMQDAKDCFADFLPDEDFPFAPEEFSSPKKIRKAMKEWEKMAEEHFTAQADALADFAIKSQEKACAELPEVPEDEEEGAAKAEPAKKTATAAKKAPAKKAAAAK